MARLGVCQQQLDATPEQIFNSHRTMKRFVWECDSTMRGINFFWTHTFPWYVSGQWTRERITGQLDTLPSFASTSDTQQTDMEVEDQPISQMRVASTCTDQDDTNPMERRARNDVRAIQVINKWMPRVSPTSNAMKKLRREALIDLIAALEEVRGFSMAGKAIIRYGRSMTLEPPVTELLPGRSFCGTMRQREHQMIRDGFRFAYSHNLLVQAIHDRVLPWLHDLRNIHTIYFGAAGIGKSQIMQKLTDACIPDTVKLITDTSTKGLFHVSNEDGLIYRLDEAQELYDEPSKKDTHERQVRRRLWQQMLSEGLSRRVTSDQPVSPTGSTCGAARMESAAVITHMSLMLIGGTNPSAGMTFNRSNPMVSRLISQQLHVSAADQANIGDTTSTLSDAEEEAYHVAKRATIQSLHNLHYCTTMIALLIATKAVPEPNLAIFNGLYKKWKDILIKARADVGRDNRLDVVPKNRAYAEVIHQAAYRLYFSADSPFYNKTTGTWEPFSMERLAAVLPDYLKLDLEGCVSVLSGCTSLYANLGVTRLAEFILHAYGNYVPVEDREKLEAEGKIKPYIEARPKYYADQTTLKMDYNYIDLNLPSEKDLIERLMKDPEFTEEFKIDKDTLTLNISTLLARQPTVDAFPEQEYARFDFAADARTFLATLPLARKPHRLLMEKPIIRSTGQRGMTLCMSIHALTETKAFNTDNIVRKLLEGHHGTFTFDDFSLYKRSFLNSRDYIDLCK